MLGTFADQLHRMLRLAIAVCSGLACTATQAQPYWALKAGSPGNDHIADVQVDVDGSIYVTGDYGGTFLLDSVGLAGYGGLDAFVARLDAAGNLIWLRRGGGAGIDRGLKLSVGNGGAVAVAGEFMGTANLFGTTLTSAAGTTDMFVALVNKTDGTLQWVRQGGGPTGTDAPAGVSMAPDGQVAVTGLFRGTAQWDATSLTSTNDPDTGLPSADVFIADYSPTGSLLWVKQGAAPKDDQAVDIIHDAAGNLYVAGQFSQDITFGQTYTNTMLNAGFLLCLAPDGTDSWFRRMGGATFNQVRDISLAPDGGLLVVGDLQGTMVWAGGTNVPVPGSGAYSYYLLKVGSDGQLLELSTKGSTSGVTVSAVAAQGNSVAVLGSFTCQFSDLMLFYGSDALFMATGTQDLFVAKHALNGLALQEAQQFGGISGKTAGGMCYLPGGDLVFCGSFQGTLIFPAQPGFAAEISTEATTLNGNDATSYCGDPNYGSYAGIVASAFEDGFLARGYVQGRRPYDWWRREGGDCVLERGDLCIIAGPVPADCLDSLAICPLGEIYATASFSVVKVPYLYSIGPAADLTWSDGSPDYRHPPITASDIFWAQVTALNGCWQWADTVQVHVNPSPTTPVISGDSAVSVQESFPGIIGLCNSQPQWVWANNVPSDCSVIWQSPSGQAVTNDSVLLDTTGFYHCNYVNSFGCVSSQAVQVEDNAFVSLDGLGMSMVVQFPQDPDQNDTIDVCPQPFISYNYVPSWTMNGAPVEHIPAGLNLHYALSPIEPDLPNTDGPGGGAILVLTEGWRVFHVVVRVDNGGCGDTLFVHGVDSVYIRFFAPVPVTVQFSGPEVICSGDTVIFTASCNICDSLAWSSPGGAPYGAMGYRMWAPGYLLLTAMAVDSNGCNVTGAAFQYIPTPNPPVLTVSPPDGILCPGAAATITTTAQGTNVVWYGPFPPISGLGTTFTTATPGTYFLGMDVQGCPLTSNSITISQYGTPFLALNGAQALCGPDDQVTIQVLATPGASIVWDAPLGGNAPLQVVDQPGTYTCSVSSCGITTTLGIVVENGAVQAAISTPSPYVLCPGDTLVLQADTGAYAYSWLPGQEVGPDLVVSQPGTYSVVMTNSFGCTDTSAAVQVTQAVVPGPPIATGDTVCGGDTAVVHASGTGQVNWYAVDGSLLGNGQSWSFAPGTSMLLIVRLAEGNCTGPADSVWVEVLPSPGAPVLTGPDSICLGTPLQIMAQDTGLVQFQWTTPTASLQGVGINIPATTAADMGAYVCTPFLQGCDGPPSSLFVTILEPVAPGIPADTAICAGESVTLQLPPGFSDVQWSTGGTGSSIVLTEPGAVSVQAMDLHGCAVQAMVQVGEEVCGLEVPNVFSPNGDGVNDVWLPTGNFKGLDVRVWNRWGNLVYEGNLVHGGWDGHTPAGIACSDGTYFYSITVRSADAAVEVLAGTIELVGSGH